MLPGVAGAVLTATFKVCAEEVPQPFVAVTDMVPPLPSSTVLMLFVVLLPVQAPGSIHV
jgi:hypothetical protein